MTNAPNASVVASQMRKRTTATERNRACDAINAYSIDLLKKLQNTKSCAFSPCYRLTFTYSSMRRVAPQARARQAGRRASSDARAG